jgi:hypothetical protein
VFLWFIPEWKALPRCGRPDSVDGQQYAGRNHAGAKLALTTPFLYSRAGNVGYAHFLFNLTFLVPHGDRGAAVAMMLVKNDSTKMLLGRSAKRANTNTSVGQQRDDS